jgi:hypothetical protein
MFGAAALSQELSANQLPHLPNFSGWGTQNQSINGSCLPKMTGQSFHVSDM